MNHPEFSIYRDDISRLAMYGLTFEKTWQVTDHFERTVADFFGAPYAVATDCCTHALELCLRLINQIQPVTVPKYTYMSVPMMLEKLSIPWALNDELWEKFYHVVPGRIIDAATLWEPNSYVPGTMMTVSFQFKKHIPIGRGGIILLDNFDDYQRLQRISQDGKNRKLTQFEDNVSELGYHYYMTPEDAARGIELFIHLKDKPAKAWSYRDYRDLTEMDFFKGKAIVK